MTSAEFVAAAVTRGYARAPLAREYVKRTPREDYTDADLLAVYRMAEMREAFERAQWDKHVFPQHERDYREEET